MKVKGIILAIITSILLITGLSNQALASHSMGGDIFYECVGQDSFMVTLNFYRDCDGTTAPNSATVGITSASCNISQNLTLQLAPTIQPGGFPNGREVSALCDQQIGNSTCNNGPLPGVEQYQYTGLFVASASCPDWNISYSLCCRNGQITTLTTPENYDLYIEATLNNTNSICNNSPRFTNLPVPYFCYLDTIFYNHGTIDFDGDSLVYTLVNPLDAPNTNIPYEPTFGVNSPLTTNGTFSFDSNTGQLFFVPQQAEVGVITIRVDEYRNGVIVGSTMRDIQVIVLGSPICNPPYGVISTSGIDSASVEGAVYIDDFEVEACPGDTVSFTIQIVGDSAYLGSNAAQAFPGATFDTSIIAFDTVIGRFTWVTTNFDTGFNVFSINYGINTCPIDRTSSQSVLINVLDGTFAFPQESAYCTDGDPIQLRVVGGNNFTWSPADGLNDSSIRNPLASPTVTTTYVVQSDLSARCKNTDTITVELVPNFILDIQPQIDTVDICRNSLTQLSVTTDTAWGPYTYAWTPGADLNDSTIINPLASPDVTTQYIATVTSDTGCVIRDSIIIDVTGTGPQVIATATPSEICDGDTVQLTSEVYPVTCGPAVGFGSCGPGNPTQILSYGTGTFNEAVTPFSGQSSDGRYQVLYRAGLLTAAGIPAGTIVRLQFDVGVNASNAGYSDLKVKMGCTTQDQLTRADWIPNTTEVFSASSYLISSTGTISLNLSQPYDWDGVSNLVIEFCYGNSTFTNAGGNDWLVSSNAGYPAAMNATSTAANGGCSLPAASIPVNQPVNNVPNLTVFVCEASTPSYTYTWSPAAGLSSTTIPNPTAVVSSPTTYTLVVSDSACDGSDFVTIDIDTANVFTNADTILCNADSVSLFVNVNTALPVICGTNGNTCTGTPGINTVGNGNTVNGIFDFPSPYAGFFSSARQQYVYTAAELRGAGLLPGRITAMAFEVTGVLAAQSFSGFTISMGCTNSSSLAVGNFETGLSTVVNPGTVTVSNNGWFTHTFDNAYDWDGQSNLVFEVCFLNGAPNTGNMSVVSTNTAAQTSIFLGDLIGDACSGQTLFPQSGGANAHPNIQLTSCAEPSPYVVSWSPGATLNDSTISNPTAYPTATTTYYVTVTTPSGCIKLDSVTVGIGTLPYVLSNDTAICNGDTVQLSVTGNNTVYTWSPAGTLSCTNCADPLAFPSAPTDYVVEITDTVLGCTVVDTVNVSFLAIPPVDLGADTTVCFLDEVTFNVGSVPGYTILWSDNSTDSTLTVSAPGPDTVYVTLSGGGACFVTDTVIVDYFAPVIVDIGPDTNTCSGVAITFDAGPGYTNYLWTTGDTTQTTTTNVGGTVGVIVTDAMGCIGVDTALLIDISPAISLGNDTIVCEGDSVFLTAASGFASYVWNTPTLTDTTVWVYTSGEYSITVTDTSNCTTIDTVNVQFNPIPVVDLGNDTIVCSGEVVTFDAGNPGLNYDWSDNSTGQTLTTGTADEYSVTVSDAIGCAASDTVVLSLYQTFPVDLGQDLAQCSFNDAFVLDATDDFSTYLWSDGSMADTLLVTAPGIVSITVTDFNGCTSSDSVNILPAPAVDAGPPTVDICIGDTVQLTATGGVIYEWSPADGLSDIQIANPLASPTVTTTYYVVGGNPTGNLVTNGDFEQGNTGFTSDYTYSPTDLFPEATYAVLADPNTAHSNFFGSDHTTGSGLFLASNGSSTAGDQVWCSTVIVDPNTNYNFSTWISSMVTNNPAQMQFTINGVALGAPILAPNVLNQWDQFFAIWNSGSATTAVICIENLNTAGGGNDFGLDDIVFETICGGTDSITVIVNDPPAIDLGADDTICPGTVFTLDAGAGMDVYDWSNGDTTQNSRVTNAGTYSVTITDPIGCVNADTINIDIFDEVTFSVDGFELCPDETDTLFGPDGYVSYLWSDSNATTSQNLVVAEAGTYFLTVTDSNGCSATDSVVVGGVGIVIDAYVDPIQINIGEGATLAVDVFNGSLVYTYSWTSTDSVPNPTSDKPRVNPDTTTTYYVTVTDTETGCTETDSVTLIVFDQTNWAFPQAFSPNGDGDNDFFEMMFAGDIVLVEFIIYNRWGQAIHDTPTGWDGTYNGAEQPIDTYVYTAVIEITTAAGTTTETVQGVFTLLR